MRNSVQMHGYKGTVSGDDTYNQYFTHYLYSVQSRCQPPLLSMTLLRRQLHPALNAFCQVWLSVLQEPSKKVWSSFACLLLPKHLPGPLNLACV
jgi:hypothetical protein